MKLLFFTLAQATDINADEIGLPKVQANDQTLGDVVGATFIAIGGIAVLYLLIGAFRYVIAGGGGSKGADVEKAKNTILYAVVGIILSVSAFTIVQFVLGRLF